MRPTRKVFYDSTDMTPGEVPRMRRFLVVLHADAVLQEHMPRLHPQLLAGAEDEEGNHDAERVFDRRVKDVFRKHRSVPSNYIVYPFWIRFYF